MNAKMSALLALGLLLASCGPRGTEPPKTDGGTVTQPTPQPTPTPTPEPTPQPTLPYDATGNWSVKITLTEPGKADTVMDYTRLPTGEFMPLNLVMLDKATGDAKGSVSYLGANVEVLTANTKAGTVSTYVATRSDYSLAWVICQGAFNASTNSYLGNCDLDPAKNPAADVADWQARRAQGYKITIQMARV